MQIPFLATLYTGQDAVRGDPTGVALQLDEEFGATLPVTAGHGAGGSPAQEPPKPHPVASLASNTHESTNR